MDQLFFSDAAPDCWCNNVKVGTCVANGYPSRKSNLCAATVEVCNGKAGMLYFKLREVDSQMGVTCKLCEEFPPQLEVRQMGSQTR